MQPLQPRQKFENCKCMLNIIMHAGVLFHHSKFIHHYNNQQCIFLWDSLGVHSRPKGNDADTLSLYAGNTLAYIQRFQLIRQNLVITLIVFFSHKINLHCKKKPIKLGLCSSANWVPSFWVKGAFIYCVKIIRHFICNPDIRK